VAGFAREKVQKWERAVGSSGEGFRFVFEAGWATGWERVETAVGLALQPLDESRRPAGTAGLSGFLQAGGDFSVGLLEESGICSHGETAMPGVHLELDEFVGDSGQMLAG